MVSPRLPTSRPGRHQRPGSGGVEEPPVREELPQAKCRSGECDPASGLDWGMVCGHNCERVIVSRILRELMQIELTCSFLMCVDFCLALT